MTLRPLLDRILIRPIEEPNMTDGGLHKPESAKSDTKIRKGIVLAVGKGDRRKDGTHVKPFCKPTDRVLYTSNPNQDWECEVEKGQRVMCSVINEEQFLYAILDSGAGAENG